VLAQTGTARKRVLEPNQPEPEVDWESPSGTGQVRARLCLPRYVFHGTGDPHWLGQPCEVLDDRPDRDLALAVLACGCRTQVRRSALKLAESEG
jgi:hypothetical protein